MNHLVRFSLAITLAVLLSTARGAFSSSLNSFCWLLDSPLREYLSGSGESALLSTCASDSILSWGAESAQMLSQETPYTGSVMTNIRVNDPSTDKPEQTTQSETTIALYKDTVLVAFVDTGQYSPRTIGVSSLSGYARSEDGGEVFADMGRVPPGPRFVGFSDPSLDVDSKGSFYVANIHQVPDSSGSQSFMGIAKSTDDGKTFSGTVLISGTGPTDIHFQDKELIAVDNTGGRFDGNVYMAWTEFTSDGSQILFVRSIDGGATFSTPIILSDDVESVQGATPAVGPDGEVYVVWISLESGRSLKMRRSDDGGVTFGPMVNIAQIARTFDPQATSNCRRQAMRGGIRILELPSITVDRSPTSLFRGTLYVVYQSDPDESGPDMSDVFVVTSFDGGQRFSRPVRVNDDRTQTDQFMPAVAVAADGTVGVLFYDRRLDAENRKIDVYFARSRNGGHTFEPNQRITDVSFEVPPTFGQRTSSGNFDLQRGICYMGDYNQMAANEKFFYLVWGDNRAILKTETYLSGRPDPDVYFAKVSIQPGMEPK